MSYSKSVEELGYKLMLPDSSSRLYSLLIIIKSFDYQNNIFNSLLSCGNGWILIHLLFIF